MTTPIPKAAPRACWRIARSRERRVASIPSPTSDQLMREPGSRYIDFLIPGLLGMNLMGSAIWGMGFAIVDARRKKLMKRLVATPMPRHYYLLSFLLSRILLLVVEVGVLVGFGALLFPRARSRFAAGSRGRVSPGVAFFQRFGIIAGFASKNH